MYIYIYIPLRPTFYSYFSAANKYYSSAYQHEQKNKKTTGQIKFSTVSIKQQIKLVLLC